MFKQYIAIILLCIFNFILVGHSIIPHDHGSDNEHPGKYNNHAHESPNDHHHYTAHHHGRQDEKNGKKESKDLSDFFSYVVHVTEFVRSENRLQDIGQTVQKEESEIAAFSFSSKASLSASDLNSEGIHYRDPDYYPPPNSHKGLRAPPCFFS